MSEPESMKQVHEIRHLIFPYVQVAPDFFGYFSDHFKFLSSFSYLLFFKRYGSQWRASITGIEASMLVKDIPGIGGATA